jgi:Kef-type K+ transport system membrane component KefB
MEEVLPFLLALALIVTAAKTAGYLSTLVGQPAVLGELLVGLILGPTMLDMLHWATFVSHEGHLGEVIYDLAQLGVLFLMFMAGLEVDLQTMRTAGRPAVLAGILGVLFPVGMGAAAVLPFGFDGQQAIFMGLVLAATSVSISAQTLMELGVLRSRVGIALLGGAVVDDVLVILALSLFTALIGGGGGGALAIVMVVVKMLIYILVAIWFGIRIIPRLSGLVDRLPISQGLVALAVVLTLLYAWTAESFGGMATITGAFLAGLLFARTPYHQHIEEGMRVLTYGFLVPVFFVSIGLEADLKSVGWEGLPLALLIIVIAMVSKVVGCGLGGLLGGFSGMDSLRLGVGMASRGEVGLIVAAVGLNAGLIGRNVFASIVLMVLATTLLTPVLLRLLYPKQEPQAEAASA